MRNLLLTTFMQMNKLKNNWPRCERAYLKLFYSMQQLFELKYISFVILILIKAFLFKFLTIKCVRLKIFPKVSSSMFECVCECLCACVYNVCVCVSVCVCAMYVVMPIYLEQVAKMSALCQKIPCCASQYIYLYTSLYHIKCVQQYVGFYF